MSLRNSYREQHGATASRLIRVTDERGVDICQLNPAAPGVIFDVVTGNPLRMGTEKWLTAVEKLVELNSEATGDDAVEPFTGEREDNFERMKLRVAGGEA